LPEFRNVPKSPLSPCAQAQLVEALRSRAIAIGGASNVRLIETHISYVLLTGDFAYKIKKAVDLGFLDFTRLPARRFYCEEEVRLNRRLAPKLYVDVVAITGTIESPALDDRGDPIEYAVRMRQFPPGALASDELARGDISPADIDAIAAKLALFHRAAPRAAVGDPYGAPDSVLRLALQNFGQIRSLPETHAEAGALDALAEWTARTYAGCKETMRRRRDEGLVRECHGDLHLGNIARFDGELTIFDCIEFNDAMRWIDVMSEVAFMAMDLRNRGRADFAHRFLNAYLQITGDYDGLTVLRFYLVYRAMVRAKIAVLRAGQVEPGDAKANLLAECRSHVDLASQYARSRRGAMIITHGLSGCGKTTRSQALLELSGAVRIRTDVERKRMHQIDTVATDLSCIEGGLYAPQVTADTYVAALAHARTVVSAGYVAIVDAAFLKRWQRDLFRTLAAQLRVPFVVVAFSASEATLRQRIVERLQAGADASDATLTVLEHQMRSREPLAASELTDAVSYDADTPLLEAALPERWRPVLDRLGLDSLPDRMESTQLSSRA